MYDKGAVVLTNIDSTIDALRSSSDGLAMLTVNQRTINDAQIRLLASTA